MRPRGSGETRREANAAPINDEGPVPTVNVGLLMGRTFITDPDEEGEQKRAKIQKIEPADITTADGRQQLYKFRCKVGDHAFEEIITYNQMLEWCNRDVDKDDMYKFDAILDHRWNYDTKKWELLVKWTSGQCTWNSFDATWEGDPVTVSMYAKRNYLLDKPGWRRCRRLAKNAKTIARMVNQVKLKNFRRKPKYKFGVQVPRDHDEAMWIDEKNGNTLWDEAERKEKDQLFE